MTWREQFLRDLWTRARRVALAIIAGLWRRHPPEEIAARMAARPQKEQVAIVAAVLIGLFLTSLLFAQAGLVGILVFFLLVILLVH